MPPRLSAACRDGGGEEGVASDSPEGPSRTTPSKTVTRCGQAEEVAPKSVCSVVLHDPPSRQPLPSTLSPWAFVSRDDPKTADPWRAGSEDEPCGFASPVLVSCSPSSPPLPGGRRGERPVETVASTSSFRPSLRVTSPLPLPPPSSPSLVGFSGDPWALDGPPRFTRGEDGFVFSFDSLHPILSPFSSSSVVRRWRERKGGE